MTEKIISKLKIQNNKLVIRYLNSGHFVPVFDKVVMAYVAVVLVIQTLLQISPFMTFLTTTPFYSIQTYLGILGGFLALFDFFTNKTLWKGKYCYLLYGILILAALASLRMVSFGIKENVFKLSWAAIQFTLVYSLAYRADKNVLKKYITAVYSIILIIWLIACVVSLFQYVVQIQYLRVVNPLSVDSSPNRQGFFDNRLFGIFYTLNHAAYMSLFLLLIGFFYILKTKRVWIRVLLIVAEFILLCHIILSVSRSAFVSLIICTMVVSWLLFRCLVKSRGLRGALICILSAILSTALLLSGTLLLKEGLKYVPEICRQFISEQYYETLYDKGMTPENYLENEEILHREGLESDMSNGRFNIWANYISLYKEVGLIGMSPGSYMKYIYENHKDMYIVKFIKENHPEKYDSGIIFHVHNGYLYVYVSAGILGGILLILFIFLCVKKVFLKIKDNRNLSTLFIGVFILALAGAISAVFDEGIFFVNNPHTTLFWVSLGILMKESTKLSEIERI